MSIIQFAILVGLIAFSVRFFVRVTSGNETVLDPIVNKKFQVGEITKLNHNTAVYKVMFKNPKAKLHLPVGQHVTVTANVDGKEVSRSYTPVSDPETEGYIELLVKSYPNGSVSKKFSELKVGDQIEMRGPKGNFVYKPNTLDHIAMVCGGSGITPVYQVFKDIANNPDDKTKATMIFGNQSEADIVLQKELDALVAKKPDQLKVYHILDKASESWTGHTGFVTKEIMEELLPKPDAKTKLLLCGPLPMTSAVKKAAVELGWEKPKAPSKPEDHVFIF